MSEFEGLVALVTGGASGIGAAIVAELAAGGAEVAVLDLRTEDVRPPLLAVPCDVTDDASCRAAVAAVVDHYGRLDIVVNNAGIGAQGTVADNSDDEWHRVFDVNVVGMVRISRAALPQLRKSPAAAIVNTCSVAGTAGLQQRALYSATKGAVLALTRAMAADHLREGIRVNCVNPGTADTPWIGRLLDSADDPARGASGAGGPAAARKVGQRRGGRGRGRLPREPALGIHLRRRPRGRRRYAGSAAETGLMEIALHTVLTEGHEADYDAVHEVIPVAVARKLRAAGVRDWRIWAGRAARVPPGRRRGLRPRCGRRLRDDPDNIAWQETVGPFFDQPDSYEGGDSGLARLWTLSDQLRDTEPGGS